MTFDLISVHYHALKAGHDYGQYVRDTQTRIRTIATFVDQVNADDAQRAQQCHKLPRRARRHRQQPAAGALAQRSSLRPGAGAGPRRRRVPRSTGPPRKSRSTECSVAEILRC
jgi:hypothetical protein